jgi:chorismate synthase
VSNDYAIREFSAWSDYEACVELQKHTWGADYGEIVPINVIRVVQKAGGIAAGAFDRNHQLLGFVFGITGVEAGTPVHWSDMLAVHADARNKGVGDALKRYQRVTLLKRGVQRVYWTFDPLESRNAHVNFACLGVTADVYERDVYGASDSPLHAGIGTDRLIVTWAIASQRVQQRLESPAPNSKDWKSHPLVNAPLSEDDAAVCEPPRLDLNADHIRIAIPADIQNLKARALAAAVEWRGHTRAAFEHYLQAGYVVVDYVREGRLGSYVLARRRLLS